MLPTTGSFFLHKADTMISLLQRYSTPFITGFFLISLISGIALFFHIGPSGFHGMHEWLSMVLILPFALHIWKNWKPMLAYFQRSPMIIALVISAIAAGAFLIPLSPSTARRDGPPQFRLAQKVLGQNLINVAPALGSTAEALTTKLTMAGFKVTDPSTSLIDIATGSGKTEADIAAALIRPAP